MNIKLCILLLCCTTVCVSQNVNSFPVDTSFTLNSAYQKEVKKYPFIKNLKNRSLNKNDEKEINKSIAKMYVNPDDNDVILNEANNIESRIDKISDNTEKERISNEVKQLKTNLKENTNAINERELPENNQPEYFQSLDPRYSTRQ